MAPVPAALGDRRVWGVPEHAASASAHTTGKANNLFLNIEQLLLMGVPNIVSSASVGQRQNALQSTANGKLHSPERRNPVDLFRQMGPAAIGVLGSPVEEVRIFSSARS
ncbi:MAG TPA: hypothetical protein VNJ02_11850 [Vicinamibacterales bacterium]|nr:hypothetical protein [Vicinamibacterales bacterium]